MWTHAIGLLAKGYSVRKFDLLTKLENGDLVPTHVEAEAFAIALEDKDATEGPIEIKIDRVFPLP